MIVVEIGMNGALPTAFAWPRGFATPIVQLARQIPGLKWDNLSKRYKGWPDAVEAFGRALEKENLARVVGRIESGAANGIKIDAARLRDYQKEGVEFLVKTAPDGGALLADDVGLGKSAQTIRAATALSAVVGSERVAVVCPAVVKSVWQDEIGKWATSSSSIMALAGTSSEPISKKFTFVILNYDIAHAWSETLRAWRPGVLVLDEAHYLQSARSRRSQACREIAKHAKARIALSATPMTVRPRDLWNVIDTLCPERFGFGPWPFFRRYADAHQESVARDTLVWNIDGSSHEEELRHRLAWFMLRRSKGEVMSELPARTRQTINIKVAARAIAPVWKEGWERRERGGLARALALSGTGKIDAAVELAQSRLAEGHSVVLFTHLRETARRVASAVAKSAPVFVLTGDAPAKERGVEIKRARETAASKPVAIVATIDAVGVGVDLSFADIGIFIDLDYVPAKLLQAEGRLHRYGTKAGAVTFYYLIGIGTADEYVRAKVIERLDLYEKVIGNAPEAAELRTDLVDFSQLDEKDVLADLRHSILAGEVLPGFDFEKELSP